MYERYHEGVPQSRPLSQTPMEPVIIIISPEGGYLISARKTLRCSSVTPSLVVNFLQLPLHTLPATTDPTSVPPENHVIPKKKSDPMIDNEWFLSLTHIFAPCFLLL